MRRPAYARSSGTVHHICHHPARRRAVQSVVPTARPTTNPTATCCTAGSSAGGAREAREGEAGQDDDGGHSPTDEEDPHGNLARRRYGIVPSPDHQGNHDNDRREGDQGTQDGFERV